MSRAVMSKKSVVDGKGDEGEESCGDGRHVARFLYKGEPLGIGSNSTKYSLEAYYKAQKLIWPMT